MLWTQAWWDLTYPNGPTNVNIFTRHNAKGLTI